MDNHSSYLDSILAAQKAGKALGIPSICSAHPVVLQAMFQNALDSGQPVLVESTCNQVNQFGGYTGYTPATFLAYIRELAESCGFSPDRVILGGDHLGPSVWQGEPASSAMGKSRDLVRDYVLAGYAKVHLDASMKLADDDPSRPLDVELSARRAAELAAVAEAAFHERGSGLAPRYVIGTEVPIPGGAHEHESSVAVTSVADAQNTIDVVHAAFEQAGLSSAWDRVIALVVQPGVEFGDDFVLEYQPQAARDLSRFIENQPIVFEAHSTDYQTRKALSNLVRDHFAILKVGPGLTFAFREAAFALAMMENELFTGPRANRRSRLIETLDEVMLDSPANWRKHYHGSEEELAFARKYSFSDRSRYYWPEPRLQAALQTLLENLSGRPLPLNLLSQYLPLEYARIRAGELANDPEAILRDHVGAVLRDYDAACGYFG